MLAPRGISSRGPSQETSVRLSVEPSAAAGNFSVHLLASVALRHPVTQGDALVPEPAIRRIEVGRLQLLARQALRAADQVPQVGKSDAQGRSELHLSFKLFRLDLSHVESMPEPGRVKRVLLGGHCRSPLSGIASRRRGPG